MRGARPRAKAKVSAKRKKKTELGEVVTFLIRLYLDGRRKIQGRTVAARAAQSCICRNHQSLGSSSYHIYTRVSIICKS